MIPNTGKYKNYFYTQFSIKTNRAFEKKKKDICPQLFYNKY